MREFDAGAAPGDPQLVAAVAAGDLTALEEIFRRHHAGVLAYCLRVSGGATAQAEDAAQDAFLRLLRYAASYDARQSFRAWLYRIARNTLVDHLSMASQQTELSADAHGRAMATGDPAAELAANDDRRRIRKALAALSREQREAIVLSRYHDMSYDEVGRILGCRAGAVKARVFRGLQRLAVLLAAPEQVER